MRNRYTLTLKKQSHPLLLYQNLHCVIITQKFNHLKFNYMELAYTTEVGRSYFLVLEETRDFSNPVNMF